MKRHIFSLWIILSMVLCYSCKNGADHKGTSGSLEEAHIPDMEIDVAPEDWGPADPSGLLEQKYITIDDSKFRNHEMPTPRCGVDLEGAVVDAQVMNGAVNFITVSTTQKITRFFIGIEGVPGFLEYVPDNASTPGEISNAEIVDKSGNVAVERAESENTGVNTYVIPLMMSQDYSGNCTLLLSAELEDGCITNVSRFPLTQLATRAGALEVKLSFNRNVDLDLHLYTPSGRHIYYETSRNGYFIGDGSRKEFGLDIDSNAGCRIDGKNKENIYIPQEYVEKGTYRVEVMLYNNCERSASTTWSVVAHYNGRTIIPSSGENPASGVFSRDAADRSVAKAMTFTLE